MAQEVALVNSASAKPAAKAKSSKSIAPVVDLTTSISLTIVKNAMLHDGKFLTDTVANIIGKPTHVQQVVFNDNEVVEAPLDYDEIARLARKYFRMHNDCELSWGDYEMYRSTPTNVQVKETSKSKPQAFTLLEALPGGYSKTDTGRVLIVLVSAKTEDGLTHSRGGHGVGKDSVKAQATEFTVRRMQVEFAKGHQAATCLSCVKFEGVLDKRKSNVELIVKQVAMTIPLSEVLSYDAFLKLLDNTIGDQLATRSVTLHWLDYCFAFQQRWCCFFFFGK